MDKFSIPVENIRNHNCVSLIDDCIYRIHGVLDVNVDINNNTVNVVHNGKVNNQKIIRKLENIGYPQRSEKANFRKLSFD